MHRTFHGNCLALAVLATALTFASAQAGGVNLLTNPGFEASGGSYDGWFTFGSGVQLSTPATDNIFLSGSAAAKIFGEFNGCPTPQFDVGGFGQLFTPTPGDVYELSGSSYMSNVDPIPGTDTCNRNRVIAKVVFFDSPTLGQEISSSEIVIGDGNTALDQWHAFSVSAPVPVGAQRVEALILFLQPGCDEGSIFVDDVVFCQSTPAAESNLLANPSFDIGLDGWTVFANVLPEFRSFMLRTPTGSAKMFGPFSLPGEASGMYQTLATTPGAHLQLDAWALNTCRDGEPITGANDNFATAKIVYLDAADGELESNEVVILDAASPLGTWTKSSVSLVAPSGTASVRVFILFIQPSAANGSIFVDDISLHEVSLVDVPLVRRTLELRQNAPNPFGSETRIGFALSRGDIVDLSVYDVTGRRIDKLFSGYLDAGAHGVSWNGKTAAGLAAPPGIYRYVLKTSSGQISRRMVLSR